VVRMLGWIERKWIARQAAKSARPSLQACV